MRFVKSLVLGVGGGLAGNGDIENTVERGEWEEANHTKDRTKQINLTF
jgi:hypothetical protein